MKNLKNEYMKEKKKCENCLHCEFNFTDASGGLRCYNDKSEKYLMKVKRDEDCNDWEEY